MSGRGLRQPRTAGGRGIVLGMLMLLVCGLAGEGGATIYTWVDRDGQVHFTDEYALVPPEYRDRVESRPSSPPAALPTPPPSKASPKKKPSKPPPPSYASTMRLAKVVAVLDGDTVVIAGGEKVRYAGLFTISSIGIRPSICKGCLGIQMTRTSRASKAARFSVLSKV